MIHKTKQNKKKSYKKRTRDLWNTRRQIQTQSAILKEWSTPDFRNTPSPSTARSFIYIYIYIYIYTHTHTHTHTHI